jgi:hypothetical protein
MIRLALVLVAVTATASIFGGGCSSKEAAGDGKRVMGSEGRERWIIQFDGPDKDLAEYRALQKESDRDAYAEKQRSRLKDTHADVQSQVESSCGGKVVEVWWMSNAMTVEIDPSKAETLRELVGKLGVKSVSPDAPLAD